MIIKKAFGYKLSLFVVSFGYSGFLSKKAPGSVGSFFASFICFLLCFFEKSHYFPALFLISFFVGIYACHVYLFKHQGDTNRDPKYVVIDEACAIFLGATCLSLIANLSPFSLLGNFFLFRVFDIWKPFPIRNMENFLKKKESTAALGIMLDDILASLMASTLQWLYEILI